MMNAMMMKLAVKATAMMAAATMFATGVPALAAHAADKNGVAETTVTESAVTRSMTKSNSYQMLGDVDTSKESYQQPVTIVNNTGKRVERMCIAAHEDTCWGDDICGRYYIDNDEELNTSFCAHDNYTVYDLYWVYEDGTYETCSEFDFSEYPADGFTITLKDGSVATGFTTNF